MSVWEIVLIGIALSMDAFAVGMTNGMSEPQMPIKKTLGVAGMYGAFQCAMPLLGYYCGYAFAAAVEKIAPWLSFALLSLIGGKSVFDFFRERAHREEKRETGRLTFRRLLLQAVATSIDALAVGVTLLAADAGIGLPFHVGFCALTIGGITFALSVAAVVIGKKLGDRFSDKAELLGGLILIAIGLKLLLEGLLS